jgi:hypothetical protein
LLNLGGDVVQTALAELVDIGMYMFPSHSGGYQLHVKFSVDHAYLRVKATYAVAAMLCAARDVALLPSPENSVLVINPRSGYARQNQSYIIGRILRDHNCCKDPRIDKAETQRPTDLQKIEDETAENERRNSEHIRIGLGLAIYKATKKVRNGQARQYMAKWYYRYACSACDRCCSLGSLQRIAHDFRD